MYLVTSRWQKEISLSAGNMLRSKGLSVWLWNVKSCKSVQIIYTPILCKSFWIRLWIEGWLCKTYMSYVLVFRFREEEKSAGVNCFNCVTLLLYLMPTECKMAVDTASTNIPILRC